MSENNRPESTGIIGEQEDKSEKISSPSRARAIQRSIVKKFRPTIWRPFVRAVNDYNLISRTVWRVGATCLLAFICGAELKHQGKRASVQIVKPELPERTEVELEALRLADTVCGRLEA